MDADYDRLISSVSHNDLSFESTQIADRMDQWILAWLNHRDTQGKGLALNLLLDRVSHFNTMVTSRIIQDKINELEIRNNMVPPLPFCWISMGSDARGEQVVRTDQDNALIYADPSKENKTIAFDYFKALAREVTQGLDQFGFTLCKGNVMATNPDWCRPLGHWLRALDNWVGSTDPDAVRKLTILLDFKAIFGDRRLAATLHARVFQNFNAHSSASHLLVRDDQLFAAPKTRFNRINTRQKPGCKSCFNIKTQAIAHIVNGARLFAVNHGIQIPSTLKRLERLRDESILTQTEFDTLTHAFVFLTRIKLISHLDKTKKELDHNWVDISILDSKQKKQLHRTLDVVVQFQKKMVKTYNQAWLNFFN